MRASPLSQNNLTRVTGIELERSNDGLQVVLKTAAGSERLVPLIVPQGNNLVIDLLDAKLAFSVRNGITEANPAPGIKSIALNKAGKNSIRLTITGDESVPNAEIVASRDDLVLNVTPELTTADTQSNEVGANGRFALTGCCHFEHRFNEN